MTTNSKLHGALARAAQVAPRRAAMPILGCARLRADGDVLLVEATDLQVYVRARLPARGSLDTCTDAARLARLLDAAGGDRAVLALVDGRLEVRVGAAALRLPAMDAGDFPAWPVLGEAWTPAPGLAAALGSVQHAMSDDYTRPFLHGAYLDTDGTVVAMDGHRLAYMAGGWAGPGRMIPVAAVAPLVALGSALEVAADPAGLRARADGCEIATRWQDADFPPWRQVTNPEWPRTIRVGREALLAAVRLVGMIAQHAILDVTAEGLRVSASDPDAGDAEIVVPCSTGGSGGAERLGLDAGYVVEALKALDGADVELRVSAGELDAVGLDAADAPVGALRQVIMPARV